MNNFTKYQDWLRLNEKNDILYSFNVNAVKYGHPTAELHNIANTPSHILEWFKEKGEFDKIVKEAPLNDSDTTKKDFQIMLKLMSNVSDEDVQFAEAAEEDHLILFADYVNSLGYEANPEELNRMTELTDPLLFALKDAINRPRPFQLAYHFSLPIYPLIYTKADSAAYPSGHSLDSANCAQYYSKKYPEIAKQCTAFADKIAMSRRHTGLHYESDHMISLYISNVIWKNGLLAVNK